MSFFQEVRYPECPFCEESDVDAAHLSTCSLRDAQVALAKDSEELAKITDLFSKLCNAKTLCDTFDAASDREKDHLWCCQECYAFGEDGAVPAVCPECKSLATSSARVHLEEHATN